MLTAVLDVAILLITAIVSYGMARLATRSEIATVRQSLAFVDKGNLRANIRADKAVEIAARAEETANEARSLAGDVPPRGDDRPV